MLMILENMAVCDLRCLNDICLAERIEEIRNVGLLILPSDADRKVREVLEKVKRTDVAAEIQAAKSEKTLRCILRGYGEFGLKYVSFKSRSGTNYR